MVPSERKFTRFSKLTEPPRIDEIPDDGFCLSAFVVLSKPRAPNRVLLGRLNKEGPWEHLAALGPGRADRHSRGWTLPSSHLILYESPDEAARRILTEQLGIPTQRLSEPKVFSEVWGEPRHWDIEFVFLGTRTDIHPTGCWSRLEFVDLTRTKKAEMSRWHEDVLAQVGRYVSDYQAP